MPSLDLSSMSSPGMEDALQVLEGRARNEVFSFSSLLISANPVKRQKRSSNEDCPATSALEEALKQLEDTDNYYDKNSCYGLPRRSLPRAVILSAFDTAVSEKTSNWDWSFADEHAKMFSSKFCTNEVAGLSKEQMTWSSLTPMARI